MSVFKLWSSSGKVYKGSELFQSDNPPTHFYTAPPAFDQDVAELQDFRNHIPSPRLVTPDTFKRLLNDLFAHPLILHAFLKMMEKWFVWMVVLSETISIWQGPGFYFLARHTDFQMIRLIKYIQQLCSQAGYNIPLSHDVDILLPENRFIENFQSLRDRVSSNLLPLIRIAVPQKRI